MSAQASAASPTAILAFLADYALSHQDGKFYVTGGGIDTLKFATIPAVYSHLSIAVRLEFQRSHFYNQHLIRLQGDIAGGPLEKPFFLAATPAPDPQAPSDPTTVQFVYNMPNVPFPRAGRYVFSIAVDDVVVKTLPLRVMHVPSAPGMQEAEVVGLLNDGFNLFGAGQVAAAISTFRSITERWPANPTAHNNLGFSLLAEGDTTGAIEAFRRAADLGFDRPELLDANIASCEYRLERFQAAYELYDKCIRERSFPSMAVLFGLIQDRIFAVQLRSAADYIGLMWLNAGWSAVRIGENESAGKFLDLARASTLGTSAEQAAFAESILRLESEIAGQPEL